MSSKPKFKTTTKGVMLNLPLRSSDEAGGLPLKLFIQKLHTKEDKDIIALKPCYYTYDDETKKFKVNFENGIVWMEPSEFKFFIVALERLLES
jgi:hypothetical protein